MTGLDSKKAKKANSKARIFCLFLAVIFILSQSNNVQIVNAARKVYVDRTEGLNTNSGESKEDAVRSLRKAKELLKGKGTICIKIDDEWIALDVEVVRKGKRDNNVSGSKMEVEPKVGNALGYSVVAEPKVEDAKTEEPKVEEPKAEETTPEGSKTEEPKAEESNTEEPKAEEPKAEESNTEEPKAEESNTEEPNTEEPKAEEPKAEEPKTEEPKVEAPKSEEPKAEELNTEEPNTENDLGHSEEEIPEQSDVEEDKNVDNLNKLVSRMTVMVEGPSDTDNVEAATQAYEALDEGAKSKVPPTVYKRLRAAQIVASSGMRTVSTPVEIVGNTGDVYDQSGTQSGSGNTSSGTNSGNSNAGNNNSGSDNKNTDGNKNTTAAKSIGAKTGDNNNIFMLVGIGTLAVAAVGGLIYFKKKKDKDDEDK